MKERITVRFGTTEILLIMFLALIVFGGGKLSGVGKALGTSIRDFRKEMGLGGGNKSEKTAESGEREEVNNNA